MPRWRVAVYDVGDAVMNGWLRDLPTIALVRPLGRLGSANPRAIRRAAAVSAMSHGPSQALRDARREFSAASVIS